jgi:hypothetical protein
MPDFGFNPEINHGEKFDGWEMVLDVMDNLPKYERV